MSENQEAIDIWNLVYWQRIYIGMEGDSIDLNHNAVWKAIEKYGIKNQTDCFEKVLSCFQITREMEEKEKKRRTGNASPDSLVPRG